MHGFEHAWFRFSKYLKQEKASDMFSKNKKTTTHEMYGNLSCLCCMRFIKIKLVVANNQERQMKLRIKSEQNQMLYPAPLCPLSGGFLPPCVARVVSPAARLHRAPLLLDRVFLAFVMLHSARCKSSLMTASLR